MENTQVQALLEEMTIEEKIGQLGQLSADFFPNGQATITGPMQAQHMDLDTLYRSGSVLGISGAKQVRAIQADFLAHNRLHIPLLFMADVVHGYKTIFPIPLGMAASFDPEIVKNASAVAASESAAGGIHVTFAPMVDLVRDPRWGRVMESTGEDTYLNTVLAAASVQGFQGEDPLDEEHIAACVKHFAAYGAPEAGREYNTVDISEWRFREQYLPSYAAAIKAQALLVMTSFNTLFGVPATANQHLMRDILREELDFSGVLISDWDAIGELINHGVAGDLDHASDLALKAGVDIDMMSFAYSRYLKRAATLDAETKRLIDESVLRILELKNTLGLFEDPYRNISIERETATELSPAHLVDAQHAAEESIVLLKNAGQILPLQPGTSVFLTGPLSESNDLLGSWSWQGKSTPDNTIAAALGQRCEVKSVPGVGYHALNEKQLKVALGGAHHYDTVIACLGIPSSESGEATSMTDIRLPEEQMTLLRALAADGKRIISIVIAGRPLDLSEVDAVSDAVVFGWFPGSRGAEAIARILTGEVEPSGRLPMSFPRSVGQVPIYYNQYNTGRPLTHTPNDAENKYLSKYIDEENTPLYPFGYGLGYAQVTLQSLTIENTEMSSQKPMVAHVRLENSSNRDGRAVVQLYLHQKIGETVRPVKRLIAFEKVAVGAGETADLLFSVTEDSLRYMHTDLTNTADAGEYELLAGLSSDATQAVGFTFTNGLKEKSDD
ncbi:glycoside hydrolase family 3 N-terminal domain-containing protein [Lacticaseibacillus mingshuiensis]|uniref:glycoside hydrolase family 3 N-terminal domain-containing protein n=1 Tax=Lacticaseibacillus mingshuiensis TaxID=2799574 RepID=UPI0019506D2A|nr:glycoside hydrolase family 3 N-terminal domain-containing protein [Lacticaseibacillus mingshuiensis]